MTSSSRMEIIVDEMPRIGTLSVFTDPRTPTGERRPLLPTQDFEIVDWQQTQTKRLILVRLNWPSPLARLTSLHETNATPVYVRRYACGHEGVADFIVRIWGRRVVPMNDIRHRLCPDCSLRLLQHHSIRCCLCGFAILPGEGVAVYELDSVKPKDFAFTMVEGHAVGCFNGNCCPKGVFYGGEWTGNGVKWIGGDEVSTPDEAPVDT